jgi:hypothetical protein
MPIIGLLAGFVQSVSPTHPELKGAVHLTAETPGQIANAHTAFNVVNKFPFICFEIIQHDYYFAKKIAKETV